jgi:hypothetical protein
MGVLFSYSQINMGVFFIVLYSVGYQAEHQDTLRKVLELSLLEKIPAIQSGWIPIEPGVFEHIHPNRMRIPHRVKMRGLPDRYDLYSLLLFSFVIN